jgi:hypothetical protein
LVKHVFGLLALALVPAFWPNAAAAHSCDSPFSTNLIAGQRVDAGDIKVCNDADTLTIAYEATFPWCLLETNLHAAIRPDPPADPDSNIPQNRRGNPQPGHFDYGEEYGDCLNGPAVFEIPLDKIEVAPGNAVVIAAHAVVEDGARSESAWGEGTRFVPRGNWATYFTYEVQEEDFDCAGAGGVEVGGFCWFASVIKQSCNQACGAVNLQYDDATRTYAGSDGTNQQCAAVLDPLGLLFTAVNPVPCSEGAGCGADALSLRCVAPATTATSTIPGFNRACACR